MVSPIARKINAIANLSSVKFSFPNNFLAILKNNGTARAQPPILAIIVPTYGSCSAVYRKYGRIDKIPGLNDKLERTTSVTKFVFSSTVTRGNFRIWINVNAKAVLCDICDEWVHIGCNYISKRQYEFFQESDDNEKFYCSFCLNSLLPFGNETDQIFSQTNILGLNQESNLENLAQFWCNCYIRV